MEARGKIQEAKSGKCRTTMGDARTLECSTSHPEWGTRRGSERPPEWRKTLGGGVTEWAGEPSFLRAPTPLEWPRSPGGTKTPEGLQRLMSYRGRTERGQRGD